MACTYRGLGQDSCKRHQCPDLLRRPCLPKTPGGIRVYRPQGIPTPVAPRDARGAGGDDRRLRRRLAHCAGGPGPGRHRSRHGDLLPIRGGAEPGRLVHDALILINRSITEYLSPESGSFDSDTQFCSAWFEQYGWTKGPFGEADVLARAKGTSVDLAYWNPAAARCACSSGKSTPPTGTSPKTSAHLCGKLCTI